MNLLVLESIKGICKDVLDKGWHAQTLRQNPPAYFGSTFAIPSGVKSH